MRLKTKSHSQKGDYYLFEIIDRTTRVSAGVCVCVCAFEVHSYLDNDMTVKIRVQSTFKWVLNTKFKADTL